MFYFLHIVLLPVFCTCSFSCSFHLYLNLTHGHCLASLPALAPFPFLVFHIVTRIWHLIRFWHCAPLPPICRMAPFLHFASLPLFGTRTLSCVSNRYPHLALDHVLYSQFGTLSLSCISGRYFNYTLHMVPFMHFTSLPAFDT